MYAENERAGIEERYEVAGNTSDLTVTEESRGAGDMLIAAGWSPSRTGMALLRLHSEWSGMAKPKRPPRETVELLAAQFRASDLAAQSSARILGKPYKAPEKSPHQRAQDEAARWYLNELRILGNGLKARSTVWLALQPWLARKGIESDTAASAILYWLDETCHVCDGLKLRKVQGQPALSARVCNACQGTGRAHRPSGSAPVLQFMDYCVSVARGSLKMRLRSAA